jgi:hypothetical protein
MDAFATSILRISLRLRNQPVGAFEERYSAILRIDNNQRLRGRPSPMLWGLHNGRTGCCLPSLRTDSRGASPHR